MASPLLTIKQRRYWLSSGTKEIGTFFHVKELGVMGFFLQQMYKQGSLVYDFGDKCCGI